MRTVEHLEAGADGQLSSLLRLLGALELLGNVEALVPEPGLRPMALLEASRAARRRAPRKKDAAAPSPWRWGDEE